MSAWTWIGAHPGVAWVGVYFAATFLLVMVEVRRAEDAPPGDDE